MQFFIKSMPEQTMAPDVITLALYRMSRNTCVQWCCVWYCSGYITISIGFVLYINLYHSGIIRWYRTIIIFMIAPLPAKQAWTIYKDRSSQQGIYSLSGKTSYRKISCNIEATRFGFRLFQSLWNLTGTSAAALPRCLSNLKAMRWL